jgi:opacity protein-like surface antigen
MGYNQETVYLLFLSVAYPKSMALIFFTPAAVFRQSFAKAFAWILLFSLAPAAQAALPSEPSFRQEDRQDWKTVPVREDSISPAQWKLVSDPSVVPAQFLPPPNTQSPESLTAEATEYTPQKATGLIGIGGGVRFGAGDSTNGVFTARAGVRLNQNISISARPTVIFGSSDLQAQPNNQTEFRLPLTLDLATQSVISPYIGAGIATNADSTGATDPMLTGGFDVRITKLLRLGFNFNYILQNSINDTEKEFITLLYLAF